jgi:4-hydroxy-3-methylbut-2-enyl diphosphate reductase
MRVIRADVLGMCFGVRDALEVAAAVAEPSRVTIFGQLVHNAMVQDQLMAQGFSTTHPHSLSASPPETPVVLITAHGISNRERRRLESAGKHLLDTTCPLVARVHQAAWQLQAEGYHVLVIGRKGHVEVEGIVGDLDNFDVIECADDVRSYSSRRLGIVCQTTMTERRVAELRDLVGVRNPHAEIRFVDTVCLPTKEHQRALERLIEAVEAVVVVGGSNSNNTIELVARCRERGRPVLHVQSAAELDPAWFVGLTRVGLTAGTSTMAATIDEVHRALIRIGGRDVDNETGEVDLAIHDPSRRVHR